MKYGELELDQIIEATVNKLGGMKGVRCFLSGEFEVKRIDKSNVISIDRSTPFDPSRFIGKGWTIWKGPADGDGLSGKEDQDERSLALTEIDLCKIRLETMLKRREHSIGGEEKIKRLISAGHIRLDARIFETLWRNQLHISERFKKETDDSITHLCFDGTILRSPASERCVLFFFFHCGWYWRYRGLNLSWYTHAPSLVLAGN